MHERTGKLEGLLEGTEEEKRLAKERLIAYIKLLIDWDEEVKEAELRQHLGWPPVRCSTGASGRSTCRRLRSTMS
jgi:hypothetical protein